MNLLHVKGFGLTILLPEAAFLIGTNGAWHANFYLCPNNVFLPCWGRPQIPLEVRSFISRAYVVSAVAVISREGANWGQ